MLRKEQLEVIKIHFGITPAILEERKRVSIYMESFASLIVDRFYDYFLSHSVYKDALDKTNLPFLKKMRINLLIALFCDEFDEHLLEKIAKLESQSPMKISNAVVASSFEILQQSILDLSSVNTQILQDIKIIMKFLRIGEYVIQEELQNQGASIVEKSKLIWILETLFEMLSVHKNTHQLFVKNYEAKSFESMQLKPCPFYDYLRELHEHENDINTLNFNLEKVEKLHSEYHEQMNLVMQCIEKNSEEETRDGAYNLLDKISKELFDEVSKPYEQTSSLTFLTVNSGIKFIQNYNRIIKDTKLIPFSAPNKLLEFIENLIQESLGHSLSWIIDEVSVTSKKPVKTYDITQVLMLSSVDVYVGLSVKNIPYKSFIFDVVKVFLEILRTTIMNREKEYTLMDMAQKAESANRSKDMFLANMSHELRTPLNAIIGFSQILQARPEIPSNMTPYIEKISISGNNLLTLVNTILDFAKLEAGKISYHPAMEYLSKIVQEVTVVLSPMAEQKGIVLTLPEDISLVLYIDAQLIKQALINLLSNAIKFTPQGGEVNLKISFNEESGEYILSVCDNGIGMSKEALSEIFSPFTQINASQHSDSKGTGLGLVITQRIVEDLHEGRIWVESEEGKGTCFHFSLPCKKDLLRTERFSANLENAQRLLIIEDTQAYVDILVEKLSGKYDLTITNSITHAKELLVKESYDKIILDFFLVDGISSELITFMRSRLIEIPTYIISAEDDMKLVEHIQEAENIVGVFNKKDINIVCDTLLRV